MTCGQSDLTWVGTAVIASGSLTKYEFPREVP